MTCARCTLRERLTDLLTDPATDHVHADLTPLFDELVGSDRPQTGLSWLRKKPGVGPQILGQMARSELEVSHAAFHSLPSDRAHDYLRTLLAAVGVLEPFDPRLERMMPWLEEFLATVPAQHAELLRRYARWHVLRRMRRAAERSQLTQASANGARRRIRVAAEFLAYLDSHGMTAQSATQRVLEEFQRHAGRPLQYERGFIAWLRNTRINTALEIPYVPGPQPQIRVGEEHRWAIVDQLLHDTSIRRYTRIGGLFTLLFAQPLPRIVTTRVDQVADRGGRVYVTFGAAPVQMPPVVDDLIREHLQHRGKSLYAARGTQWLFPGGNPGQHLSTENIRAQLVQLGIRPSDGRKAALFQLVAEVPAPVLAELVGLTNSKPPDGHNWPDATGGTTSPHEPTDSARAAAGDHEPCAVDQRYRDDCTFQFRTGLDATRRQQMRTLSPRTRNTEFEKSDTPPCPRRASAPCPRLGCGGLFESSA